MAIKSFKIEHSGSSGDITTTTDPPGPGTSGDFNETTGGNSTGTTVTDFLTTLCGDDEACYRRSAQKVTTTAAPTMLPGPGTTVTQHQLPCTPQERQAISCLHDGRCFVIKVNEYRERACSCTPGRTGERCGLIAIPEFDESRQSQIRTAHIAAGLSVAIIIVFALLLALYVWHRLRKGNPDSNSTETDPLNEKGQMPQNTCEPYSEQQYSEQPASAVRALNNNSHADSVNGVGATAKPSEVQIHIPLVDKNSGQNRQSDHSGDAS